MTNEISFTVSGESGRIDKVLHSLLKTQPDYELISRSLIQEWIEEGNVTVSGKLTYKSSAQVREGDTLEVVPPPIATRELAPYEFPLIVLYEDDDLVVIDKPAGLTVHPGAGNKDKTLVNALVARYGAKFGDYTASDRPGVVHRLDKDTTGVLVVARTEKATKGLISQFSSRQALREYRALVRTLPRAEGGLHSKDKGSIDANIGRNPNRRTEMAVLKTGGLHAVTHWEIEERFQYGSVAKLNLETGRTHQIRVHMDYVKSPVIGDPTYGEFSMLPQTLLRASRTFGRQALHAFSLGFIHPVTEKSLKFESPIPLEMAELIEEFRKFA